MGFMQAYKHLDNLCRDMNGIGITGYIEDMEKIFGGEYSINGWNDDYYTLKHLRYIRNQISHEEYATEENMTSDDDTDWLNDFYDRIMSQTDPLALYHKAITKRDENMKIYRPQTTKATYYPTHNSPPPPQPKPPMQYDEPSEAWGMTWLIAVVIIIAAFILFFNIK